jgi:predicted RNase H-like nuclease
VNLTGIEERENLLIKAGMPQSFFAQNRPTGLGLDDLVDASACCVTARRLAQGQGQSFPDNPPCDKKGLAMAIWV